MRAAWTAAPVVSVRLPLHVPERLEKARHEVWLRHLEMDFFAESATIATSPGQSFLVGGLFAESFETGLGLSKTRVSLAYLIGGTLAAPDLWADPLGPLVKVLPGISLALFVLAFADER